MKLHSHSIPLGLLAPCWLTGATQTVAEWRVATLRGQVRWWLRALAPGCNHDIELLGGPGSGQSGMTSSCLRLDSTPLGNADAASYILESYRATKQDCDETYFMWPIADEERRRGAWMPRAGDAAFDMRWQCLRPVSAPLLSIWQQAMTAFSLLGAIGGRSSRGYGSLWPRAGAPVDESALTRELATLPPHIKVRLLDGSFRHPREALARAARWWKELRAGSPRSGVAPSAEGRQDHDLGLDVLAGRAAPHAPHHRAVLGLPLTQAYSWPPSPVRLKLVRFGESYRILVIVLDHDDYRWPVGTPVKLNGTRVAVSHDILAKILGTGTVIH